MNLNYTRILIIVTGFIGFIRDYFFVSNIIYHLILSLMVIEIISSNVINAVTLRSNNYLKNQNFFYSKKQGLFIIKVIFFSFVFFAISLSYLFYILSFNKVYFLLVFALPFNATYRYLYIYFNINKSIQIFQFLEIFKHTLNLLAFYYVEPLIVLINYFSISLFVFLYWYKTSINLDLQNYNINLIAKFFKEDKYYFINSFCLIIPLVLDKFIIMNGTSSMEYLLITKYLYFNITFINVGFILPAQVKYKENGMFFEQNNWIKKNYLLVIFFIVFQFLFFFKIVNFLPISSKIDLDYMMILSSMIWTSAFIFFITVHREIISKELTNKSGKLIVLMTMVNICFSLFINYFGPTYMMIIQSLILLSFSTFMKIFVIGYSNK